MTLRPPNSAVSIALVSEEVPSSRSVCFEASHSARVIVTVPTAGGVVVAPPAPAADGAVPPAPPAPDDGGAPPAPLDGGAPPAPPGVGGGKQLAGSSAIVCGQ